jgi:hypothetical protein
MTVLREPPIASMCWAVPTVCAIADAAHHHLPGVRRAHQCPLSRRDAARLRTCGCPGRLRGRMAGVVGSGQRLWERWAAVINRVQGRRVGPVPPHSLDGWQCVMTELGDVDVLLRALPARRRPRTVERPAGAVDDARVLRMARPPHHVPTNPSDAPELSVKRTSSGEVLAFRTDYVERLLAAAAAPPPSNVRSAWPTREVAVVEAFAHCGVRVSELVGLTVASIERDRQQVLLKVRAGARVASSATSRSHVAR